MRYLLITILLITSLTSFAGVEMKFVTEDKKDLSAMKIGKEDVKIKTTDKGEVYTMLYHGKKNALHILDHKSKTYMVIDNKFMAMQKSRMSGMGKQMPEMQKRMAAMQEKMKSMPPQQRKMMEQMMKKMPGMQPTAPVKKEITKVKFVKKESAVKVGEWVTDHYVGMKGKTKTVDIWSIPYKQIGIEHSDMKPLARMQKLMKEMSNATNSMMGGSRETGNSGMYEFFETGVGMPVKTISTKSGNQKMMTLDAIRKRDLKSSEFKIPEGFSPRTYPTR